MRRIKTATITLLVVGLFGLIAHRAKDFHAPFAPTQLERLVFKLEGQYRRSLDVNGYSLHYTALPPDTVVIQVRHYPNVDRNNMNSAIESVKSLIRGLAHDVYGIQNIQINSRVEWTELPPPRPKSPIRQ